MAGSAALLALALLMAAPATAQYANDAPPAGSKARRDDAYRPADSGPGLGTLSGPSNNPYSNGPYSNGPSSTGSGATAQAAPNDGYTPRYGAPERPYGSGDTQGQSPPLYNGPANGSPNNNQPADVYRPPQGSGGYDQRPAAASQGGYGQPYGAPPDDRRYDDRRNDDRRADDRRYDDRGPGPRDTGPRNYDREGRNDNTYTSEEILHAGGSFFGSVTQNLARVVENSFQKQGRPNGYILGEEGGGAFIAGLRYGSGTLYTRDEGTRRVHWQGPSVGFDVGGAGSRMMILVYNLHSVDEIYERFGGVDGSAYIVGGIGMTLLTREHITLAPIRSGLGLRLGANVGYLKFTRKGTINPF